MNPSNNPEGGDATGSNKFAQIQAHQSELKFDKDQQGPYQSNERMLLPRQGESSSTGGAPTNEMIEKRKNEIVTAMLGKIKPFVGSNGSIKPDADFESLAKVMEHEGEFLGRTLILTVLVSSTEDPKKGGDEARAIVFLLCDRLTKCPSLLAVLHKWLSDSSKSGEPTCHLAVKIMQILGRIHLNVDQLVQYKFGKLVKKILGRDEVYVGTEAKRMAEELMQKWSKLAEVEEGRRRQSSTNTVISEKRSLESENSAAVENMDLFSEAPKTRAAMILERASKAQSSASVMKPSNVTTRYLF